jgi:hypothetical protein
MASKVAGSSSASSNIAAVGVLVGDSVAQRLLEHRAHHAVGGVLARGGEAELGLLLVEQVEGEVLAVAEGVDEQDQEGLRVAGVARDLRADAA